MRYWTVQEQDYGVDLPQSRLSNEMNETTMTDANTIEPKYNNPLEEGAVVSNLPLLFANGHPTSLEKITLTQLERFVTFMVQCSLGHDTTEVISEPRWWPKEVKFSNPLTRPKRTSDNWMANLKKIVFRCYTYHRSEYLLRFCSYLARYPHEDLEYVNNWDSTTSLYHKNTGKLLVTFRNENMNYDRKYESPRKKLLSCSGVVSSYCNKSKPQQHSITMVEPPTEDIYLCDNCDAQFIALDKMKEHERVCSCVEQERDEGNSRPPTPDLPAVEPELRQDQFLEYFQLCSVKVESKPVETNNSVTVKGNSSSNNNNNNSSSSNNNNNNNNNTTTTTTNTNTNNNDNSSSNSIKRNSRRVRGSTNFARCSTIPFSSPAGILLAKKSKAMTEETQQERLERIERHLIAPVLNSSSRPKWLETEVDHDRWIVTHKPNREKPGYNYVHQYQFVNSVKRKPMLSIQSQLLYIVCRPVCVLLTRVTQEQINRLTQNPLKYHGCLVENISVGNKESMTEDQEKATRQNVSSKRKAPSDENDINTTERNEKVVNSEASNEKLTVFQGKNFCDENCKTVIKSIKGRALCPNPRLDAITVIDLCSSDEEDNPCTLESSDENRDPMNCMAESVKKTLLQKLSSSKLNLEPRVRTTEQTREWLPDSALINDDAENYTNKCNVNVSRTCISPVLGPAP